MTGTTGPRTTPGGRRDDTRWVAHSPFRPPVEPATPPPVSRYRLGPAWQDATPRYPGTPRWGLPALVLAPPPPPAAPRPRRAARWARRVDVATTSAGRWCVVAAIAHLVRYGMLAAFADRIVPYVAELLSVGVVWVTGLVALLHGVLALVCCTAWLVERRHAVYGGRGGADHRPAAQLWASCLLPVVTLVRPAVFLHELVADDPDVRPGALRRVRRWWGAWVLNWALVALAAWRGSAAGPQADADTVLLTALAFGAAAWAAFEVRGVTRSFAPTSPGFTRRFIARGTVVG